MRKVNRVPPEVVGFIPQLAEELCKKSFVVLIYLFGSLARNEIGPLSDVDIAVLLEGNIPRDQYFSIRQDLFRRASSILRTDEVDVVILNRATPLMKYQIIKYGRLLYAKTDSQKNEFEQRVLADYFDTTWLRKVQEQCLLKRVKNGKVGVRFL